MTLWLLQATKAQTHEYKIDSLQTDMEKYFNDLDKITEIVWIVIVPQELQAMNVYRAYQPFKGDWRSQGQIVQPWQCVSFLNVQADP